VTGAFVAGSSRLELIRILVLPAKRVVRRSELKESNVNPDDPKRTVAAPAVNPGADAVNCTVPVPARA
jgi:hypothetical protein